MQKPPAVPDDDALIPEPDLPADPERGAMAAGLSATAHLVDRNGIAWRVTVPADADGKAFVAFLDVLGAAGAYALAHGFGLPGGEPVAAAPAAVPAEPVGAAVHVPGTTEGARHGAPSAPAPTHVAPPPAAHAAGEQSFVCTELAATVVTGKPYWRVKGGSFAQYGVTVWPEVLEAVGLVDLDVTKVYDLQGWEAGWVADAQGRRKVTRLAPPS